MARRVYPFASTSRFEPGARRVGSIDSVSDAAGVLKVRLSYDAFGKRRNEAGWAGSVPVGDLTGIANTTRHGYTEHEMLDNLTLTHMNGRVFDQTIGRFISADPFVQAPDFSQSLNRYAYVWNNPLSFTDPSGFETEGNSFRFGFGPGWVSLQRNRYPPPHMQPPPRKDGPVGTNTQATVQGAPSPNGADSGLDSSASCAGIEGATPNWNPGGGACSLPAVQVQVIGLCEDGAGDLCDLTELEHSSSDVNFAELGRAVGERWDYYWREEFRGDVTIAVSVTGGGLAVRVTGIAWERLTARERAAFIVWLGNVLSDVRAPQAPKVPIRPPTPITTPHTPIPPVFVPPRSPGS